MSDIPQEIAAASRLADLRGKVLRGEFISPEEYAEVIRSIRIARKADGAKTKKAAASNADPDKILRDFVV